MPCADPNKIDPSRFHVPPENPVASQISAGGPPEASTFFSFPPLTKPMERLSADEKGCAAFSVPARRGGVTAPIGRTKRNHDSPVLACRATNATARPSGDREKFVGLNTPMPATP